MSIRICSHNKKDGSNVHNFISSRNTGAVAVCCWYASTVEKLRFGSGYECGMFKRSTEPCHVSKIEDSD